MSINETNAEGNLNLDRIIFDWLYELNIFDRYLKNYVNTKYINTKTIGLSIYTGVKVFNHLKDKIKRKRSKTISIDQDSRLYKPLLFYLIHGTDFFDYLEQVEVDKGKNNGDPEVGLNSSSESKYYSLNEELHKVQIPDEYIKKVKYNGAKFRITRSYQEKSFNNNTVTLKFEEINIYHKKKDSKKVVEFLKEAIKYYYEEYLKRNTSVSVYQSKSWGHWKEVKSSINRPIESVMLHGDLKERIISDLKDFIRKKEYFLSKGIPYKRNYLFHGVSGSGKTSLIKALGTIFKRDIYFLAFSHEMSNGDFLDLISDVPENSILVFEEIDVLFDQRSSEENNQITFSAFINALDGIITNNDIITIITTNHIEKMDEALLRTGRIDKMYEFGGLTLDIAKKMLFYLRGIDSSNYNTVLKQYVKSGKKPSDLQNILIENETKKKVFYKISNSI